MNNKGQTLVCFVIIIPVFIILLAFIVDTGIILKNRSKLTGIIENTIYNDITYDEVSDIMIKNDIPIDNLEVINTNEYVEVKNSYYIDSIFGKIIGIKHYKIDSDIKKNRG